MTLELSLTFYTFLKHLIPGRHYFSGRVTRYAIFSLANSMETKEFSPETNGYYTIHLPENKAVIIMNLANKFQNSELDTQYSARLSHLLTSKTPQQAKASQSVFEISLQATFDSREKVENISLSSDR